MSANDPKRTLGLNHGPAMCHSRSPPGRKVLGFGHGVVLTGYMRRREFITSSRRRCGRVAGVGLGAAARADAAHRRTHGGGCGRSGRAGPHRGVPPRIAAIGLDRRPQRADRHPLGRGRCRPHAQIRGGIGLARARRHPGLWRHGRGGIAPGDPHRADRVHADRRSGRRRLRREPGAAGRQRHRIHTFRIRHEREMAGAAQRDRAARDASGGPSGCNRTPGGRPVRRNPGRGAVVRGGAEPDRRARRRRDRARRHGIRAHPRMAA